MRGCVVGLGVIGSIHARLLSELEKEKRIEFVGVSDVKRDIAKEIGKKFNVRWFTTHEELLDEGQPDFVIISVPTECHLPIAVDFANHGCHLFVEKPLAPTVEQGIKILKASKKNNVRLMVGHVERFNPAVMELKDITKKETILLIGAMRVGPMPPLNRLADVILDLAVHDIDVIRYLTNSEFKSINSFCSQMNLGGFLKSAVLSFEMENGALAYIISNVVTPFKIRRLEVTTELRFIRADLLSQKVTEYFGGRLISHAKQSALITEIDIPYKEPLKLEVTAFIESVEKDEAPPITGEDGLKTLEIALECLRRCSRWC